MAQVSGGIMAAHIVFGLEAKRLLTAVQIGGISALAPTRPRDLARLSCARCVPAR